jgi:hypothetical protein
LRGLFTVAFVRSDQAPVVAEGHPDLLLTRP